MAVGFALVLVAIAGWGWWLSRAPSGPVAPPAKWVNDGGEPPPAAAHSALDAPRPEPTVRVAATSGDPAIPAPETETALSDSAPLTARVLERSTLRPIEAVAVAVSYGEQRVLTDAQGRFTLADLPVGEPTFVGLVHEDFAVERVALMAQRVIDEELTLTMARGLPMTVRMVDEISGAPLSGATVRHFESNMEFKTDALGVARLRLSADCSSPFRFEAPDYSTLTWFPNRPQEEDVLVPMQPLGYIEGTLLGPMGERLAGARLSAFSRDRYSRGRDAGDAAKTLGLSGTVNRMVPRDSTKYTTEDGAFSIPVLPGEAPFRVKGGAREFMRAEIFPVHVTEPGQRVRIEVQQLLGGSITGLIKRNGVPIPKGLVVAKSGLGAAVSAKTDRNGSYRLKGVPPGPVEVTLEWVEFLKDGEGGPVTVQVTAGKSVELNFVWDVPLKTISGRLLGSDGGPVAGALVSASRHRNRPRFDHFSASTDASGAFEIEVRPGPPYRLESGRGPKRAVAQGVPAGATGVELRLRPTGRFALRFTDAATGSQVTPVTFDTYSLLWGPLGGPTNSWVSDEKVTPEGLVGHIRFDDASTSIDVSVGLPKTPYLRVEARAVPVAAPGEELRFIDVPLTRGLSGTVHLTHPSAPGVLKDRLVFLLADDELGGVHGPLPRDDDSSNFRYAELFMRLESRRLSDRMLKFDSEGNALLRRWAPGRYTLRAFPDEVSFEPAVIDIAADAEEFTIRVETK